GIYHAVGTNPDGSRYSGMASIVSVDSGYDVTWWIGKQLFHGSGHLAGRMLIVEWGDAHPVIYPIGNGPALDGEWADGTATETLERVGTAGTKRVSSLAGNAAGRNPDGSRYDGTVAISQESGRYRLSWRIGKTGYQGTGRLSGNILVVDWGSSTPVVYAV